MKKEIKKCLKIFLFFNFNKELLLLNYINEEQKLFPKFWKNILTECEILGIILA